MQKGTIKHYNTEKGYGFITSGAEELFFHFSAKVDKNWNPQIGEEVTFNSVQGEKGLKAENVALVSDAASDVEDMDMAA